MPEVVVDAMPFPFTFDIAKTALIVIDMQRDFLEPGGFGESLGNDVSKLRKAIEPCKAIIACAREVGMAVIHTREGHRPDLTDLPKVKFLRGPVGQRIGDPSPMGRILVRGEPGHDIISELYPIDGEPVVDKPGKGAFYATDLDTMLRNLGAETLIICGVTTEVCVHTTVREGNDRGYACLVPSDACASFFDEFHEVGLKMVAAQGGIFGAVSDVASIAAAARAAVEAEASAAVKGVDAMVGEPAAAPAVA